MQNISDYVLVILHPSVIIIKYLCETEKVRKTILAGLDKSI